MRSARLALGSLGAALLALPAAAQVPDAPTLLGAVGLAPDQIQQVMAGEVVRGAIQPASERELVAAMAFLVKTPPGKLVEQMKGGLGNRVDPETLAFGEISGEGSAQDFAKLTLAPDPQQGAQAYLEARPGGDLNLSSDEIAAFQKLAKSGPAPAAVESAVRESLLARYRAYRQRGLAGIPPYALAGGKQRSPAEELRTATEASKALKRYVPAAWQMLESYPAGKPAGTQEVFRWTRFNAHGTPSTALVHLLYVPDGSAWLLVQRMFYVSAGLNAEQALAALVPVEGGTLVVYGNRTSTDQVSGFGGSAKRSIGSRVLESQLEDIFQKARSAAAK